MPANIFINYRKDDSQWQTQNLYTELLKYFPRKSFFKDIDTIQAGQPFKEAINEALTQCEIFLVVIAKNWLEIKNKDGLSRLSDANDLLRIEIATALKRGIRVIPVLYDNIEMFTEKDLPEDIRPLVQRQYVSISYTKFESDVKVLVAAIKVIPFNEVNSPSNFASRLPAAAITAFIGALVSFIGISWVLLSHRAILPRYSTLTPMVIRDTLIAAIVWFVTGALANGKKNRLIWAVIASFIFLAGWLVLVQLTVHAAREPYVISHAISFGMPIGSVLGVIMVLLMQKNKISRSE